jgi:hypothetical protein
MAPNTRAHARKNQDLSTAQFANQNFGNRGTHMAQTKPLSTGMRAAGSGHETIANNAEPIATAAKEAKKRRKAAGRKGPANTGRKQPPRQTRQQQAPWVALTNDANTMDTDDPPHASEASKRERDSDEIREPSPKRMRSEDDPMTAPEAVDAVPPVELPAETDRTTIQPQGPAQPPSQLISPQEIHHQTWQTLSIGPLASDEAPTDTGHQVEHTARISKIPFDGELRQFTDNSDTPMNTDTGAVDNNVQMTSPHMIEKEVRQLSVVTLPTASIDGGPPVPRVGLTASVSDDAAFVQEMIAQLERVSKWKTKVWYREQARRLLQVLRPAQKPDGFEILILTPGEARTYFDTNAFFPGPIFVDGAQPMELGTIKDFLGEYYDNSAAVSIQDSSISLSKRKVHVRATTIGQLKERFAAGQSKMPWNCLELACHVEDGLRPTFLNNEDCRLLTKLKLPANGDHTSRRRFEKGFKEVEKWALLAQAGSLTAPHQDSHGYSTYITVQEGNVGFGWLSNASDAEHAAWLASPSTFVGGNWRYKILHPGMTVYFPNGTVHFVFRLGNAGDTLAYGGHVLRCSRIVSWAKTLIDERGHRAITNEDISVSAPAFLDRVAKFVKQARRMGQEEKWGGKAAIAEFLRLKEKFDAMG